MVWYGDETQDTQIKKETNKMNVLEEHIDGGINKDPIKISIISHI